MRFNRWIGLGLAVLLLCVATVAILLSRSAGKPADEGDELLVPLVKARLSRALDADYFALGKTMLESTERRGRHRIPFKVAILEKRPVIRPALVETFPRDVRILARIDQAAGLHGHRFSDTVAFEWLNEEQRANVTRQLDALNIPNLPQSEYKFRDSGSEKSITAVGMIAVGSNKLNAELREFLAEYNREASKLMYAVPNTSFEVYGTIDASWKIDRWEIHEHTFDEPRRFEAITYGKREGVLIDSSKAREIVRPLSEKWIKLEADIRRWIKETEVL